MGGGGGVGGGAHPLIYTVGDTIKSAYIAPGALTTWNCPPGPNAGPEPYSVNDITPVISPPYISRWIDAHDFLIG